MSSYVNRHGPRLAGYDYSREGVYFVTLCVQGRLLLFGSVVDGEMQLSGAGHMVADVWNGLPRYYVGIAMDEFVVMPNHLHGIVVKEAADSAQSANSLLSTALSIPAIVQRFKSFTTRQYGKGVASDGWLRYNGKLWQTSYHDRIVRNERELDAIREYIANNPLQWHLDRENPSSKT